MRFARPERLIPGSRLIFALAVAAVAGSSVPTGACATPAAADSGRVQPESLEGAGLVVRGARADTTRGVADTANAIADTTLPDSLPFVLRETRLVGVGGAGARGLAEPSGVAVDAFGRLYVADRGLHRLARFDASGAWLGERGALGSEATSLRRPSAVALAGTFTVAVLDEDNRRVVGYDLYGERVRTLVALEDPAVRDAAGRVRPVGLAGDRGGALYVADADQDRVVVFDSDGRWQRTLGGFGERAGAFRGLVAVAVGRRGDIVTVEREGARVQRLDAGGRALAAWPLAGPSPRGRAAVAVDDSGRVAVADEAAGRVWVFAADGRLLAAQSDLAGPSGLSFGKPGELWVAESRAGRVRRLDLVPRVAARGGGP